MRWLAVAFAVTAMTVFAPDAGAQTSCSQAFAACARPCGWIRRESFDRCLAHCRSQRFQCIRTGTFRTRKGTITGLSKS